MPPTNKLTNYWNTKVAQASCSLSKDLVCFLKFPDGLGGEVLPQLHILCLVQSRQELLGQVDEAEGLGGGWEVLIKQAQSTIKGNGAQRCKWYSWEYWIS